MDIKIEKDGFSTKPHSRKMIRSFVILLLLAFLNCVVGTPYHVPMQGKAGGKRTLVLLDDVGSISSYSLFFADLSARGHEIRYAQADSSDLQLKVYGEYLYDNIILFAPKSELSQDLTTDDIQEFVKDGGNMLIAVNKEVSGAVRDFVESFGVELDPKSTEVIDHFEYEESLDRSRQHLMVLAKETVDSKAILGSFNGLSKENPILYRGVGHTIAADNILAVRILRGNPTSYSTFPNKAAAETFFRAGQDALLVSGIQGRNNARMVFSGSLDAFTNEFFAKRVGDNKSQTGNRQFFQEVSKWAFGEAGVLRFRDITHYRSDGVPPDVILHEKERPDLPVTLYPDPEIARNALVYRIKDEIVYSMIVEQYVDGEWKPFHANDMQMEFVMLDAHVRKTMKSDPTTGKFTAIFTAPDNYGIFKFRVLYRRPGYSIIHAETQVSLRPFKHNEYERFIFAAYPYYASALSATAAFLVFTVAFLFSSDK